MNQMKLAGRMASPLFMAAAMQEAIYRRDKYFNSARHARVPNFSGQHDAEEVKRLAKLARAWNRIAMRHKRNAEATFSNAIAEASGLRSRPQAP